MLETRKYDFVQQFGCTRKRRLEGNKWNPMNNNYKENWGITIEKVNGNFPPSRTDNQVRQRLIRERHRKFFFSYRNSTMGKPVALIKNGKPRGNYKITPPFWIEESQNLATPIRLS